VLGHAGAAPWVHRDIEPQTASHQRLPIFTAVQEQLGLKLAPAKVPLDRLVIDHIERPDPD